MSLAGARIDYTFRGRASHAAAAPHLGRSALDAVELMNVGVNYMREHMPSDARIHYAMIDWRRRRAERRAGIRKSALLDPRARRARHECAGRARAQGRGRRRADDRDDGGGAGPTARVSNLLGNTPLETGDAEPARAARAAAVRCGRPPVCGRRSRRRCRRRISRRPSRASRMPVRKDTPLCDFVVPYGTKGAPMIGSTDVGDVSWVVPTVQARVATRGDRHAGAFLADHRAGQVRARPRRAWSMPPR